jgi:cobaltochelatase CobN
MATMSPDPVADGRAPLWRAGNRQVAGVELMPLEELQRPRIDVTTRISGFFRDAFPQLIELIDDAVQLAIAADEPEHLNFVRKHYLRDLQQACKPGWARPRRRPGGLPRLRRQARQLRRRHPALIQEKNWQDQADFAEAYINWGGLPMAAGAGRRPARGLPPAPVRRAGGPAQPGQSRTRHLRQRRLPAVPRRHDRHHPRLSGQQPRHYFGDSHDPHAPPCAT